VLEKRESYLVEIHAPRCNSGESTWISGKYTHGRWHFVHDVWTAVRYRPPPPERYNNE